MRSAARSPIMTTVVCGLVEVSGRHDRGVGDPQPVDAANPQPRVDDGASSSMPILQEPAKW